MSPDSSRTLLLVDGNALLYRAYFAFPQNLTSPAGELVGAAYGFTRILLTTIKTLQPACVAVCFDLRGPTFRHLQYEAYKATRQKMPEDLAGQIKRVAQIVEHLEVPIYTQEGYEADDVIGTLARQAVETTSNTRVVILTGDQDIIQLVNDRVSVYTPGVSQKSGPTLFTPAAVEEKYGFAPAQMIEYKALRGDPSDNIPGVPGVGEVTATKLIKEYGTIETLYAAIKSGKTDLKPALLQKLTENKELAYLSQDLATIRTDAPVTLDLDHCQLSLQHPEKLIELFKELNFKSLLHDLPTSQKLIAQVADVFGSSADTSPNTPTESTPSTPNEPPSKSEEIEETLAPTLREMEVRGVKIDRPYLQNLEKEFDTELQSLRIRLNEEAGEEFNPDSPSQVGHILYEVLHIPTDNVRKGKTGYTTDAATLQELSADYPITQLLLQYREIGKLQNTYVKPLQILADDNDRVHTSYAPDTATGRISSKNPNLQNIPIRSEQGRRLRRAFIAKPDHLLIGADYSQMELRVAAHLSGDPAMQEAFRQGNDFHTETAARMGIDRHTAKIINFSILYGKGPFGFAKDLNTTVAKAKQYIEEYFRTYSVLRTYLDSILETGRRQGYLETIFGRKRYFPDLTSNNFRLRSAAEREALNMPIQGSQADILKQAMCDLAAALKEQNLQSHLILTVHDELVLEVPVAEATQAAALLKEKMIHAVTLTVPVEVSVKQGTNWEEMTPFTFK